MNKLEELDKQIQTVTNRDILIFLLNKRHKISPYPKYLFDYDNDLRIYNNEIMVYVSFNIDKNKFIKNE